MRKNVRNRYVAVAAGGAIDWDHPRNKNLVALWGSPQGVPAAGNRWLNLAYGFGGRAPHGTMANEASFANGALLLDGVNDYVSLGAVTLNCSSTAWTLTWYGSIPDLTAYRGIVTNDVSHGISFSSNGTGFLITTDDTNNQTSVVGAAAGLHVYSLAFYGTNFDCWRDGVNQGSITPAFGATGFSWTGVNLLTTDLATWSGAMRMMALHSRTMPAGEIPAWHAEILADFKVANSPLRWYSTRTLFVPTAAGITFDAASNGGYTAAANTDTWSHTNAGNYLVVGVAMLGVANVTGITYNGVALTLLGSKTSAGSLLRVELWGLAAPFVGAANIVVSLDGSIAFAGVASSWGGVHQTSPTEGFNSATATNVGAADATVDVTTVADNCVVVDVMASSDGSVTVGAGQTERNNVTGAAGSGTMSSEGPKTPAGSVTMSWTDVGALATWVTGGIALRPLAASNLGTGWMMLLGVGA